MKETGIKEKEEKNVKEKVMSYQKTLDFIESLRIFGSVPGLDSISHLCEKLGNPQDALQFVHIAGTNGKGSVLCFISTVLQEAGYKTGRFLSPAVLDYREIIQVNGKMISKKDLCIYMTRLKQACEELTAEGKAHPTLFEVETALAFLYFQEKNCEIVVLETGMGGELDATNLVKNTITAVITPISYDHMQFLGNTLGEIAGAKAGIIKPDCTAVTIRQEMEIMEVIQDRCREKGVPLRIADLEQADYVRKPAGELTEKSMGKSTETRTGKFTGKQKFSYKDRKNLIISMPGTYQTDNAALSLEVLDVLSEKGFPVSEKALYQGFLKAFWPGRFEMLCKSPALIADGAHNRDGAKRLADSIRFYFTNRRIIYIMGILRDKEQEAIIKLTSPYAEQILTVPTGGPRGTSSYELACEVRNYHENVTAADSVEEAVELAFLLADKDTVIVAFGSLSYLGKLIKEVSRRKPGQGIKV